VTQISDVPTLKEVPGPLANGLKRKSKGSKPSERRPRETPYKPEKNQEGDRSSRDQMDRQGVR
jgi:hypothetical protein